MLAHARPFNFLKSEGHVEIPFFQRAYVWEEQNWRDLLADLTDAVRNPFLGSIILKQTKQVSGQPKRVLVIDGQQRLTTLCLLLKALFDTFPEPQRGTCLDYTRTILFFQPDPMEPRHDIRISHSQLDREIFERIMT